MLGEGAERSPIPTRGAQRPGADFGAVWGERGVAEFKLRLQADFNLGFTRHAPQAGVRRIIIPKPISAIITISERIQARVPRLTGRGAYAPWAGRRENTLEV